MIISSISRSFLKHGDIYRRLGASPIRHLSHNAFAKSRILGGLCGATALAATVVSPDLSFDRIAPYLRIDSKARILDVFLHPSNLHITKDTQLLTEFDNGLTSGEATITKVFRDHSSAVETLVVLYIPDINDEARFGEIASNFTDFMQQRVNLDDNQTNELELWVLSEALSKSCILMHSERLVTNGSDIQLVS